MTPWIWNVFIVIYLIVCICHLTLKRGHLKLLNASHLIQKP